MYVYVALIVIAFTNVMCLFALIDINKDIEQIKVDIRDILTKILAGN